MNWPSQSRRCRSCDSFSENRWRGRDRAVHWNDGEEKDDGAGEGETGAAGFGKSPENESGRFDQAKHADAAGVNAKESAGRSRAFRQIQSATQNEAAMTPEKRSPVANGVQIALATIGLLVALWLVMQLRSICVLLLMALVLATGIHPVVEWLQARRWPPGNWRCPRAVAIGAVLLAVLAVALGLFYFLGSVAWHEGSQAWNDLPLYVDRAAGWLDQLRAQFPQIPSNHELGLSLQNHLGRAGNYFWQTTSALLGLLGVIGSALTILVLTFYMLLETESLRRAYLALIPPDRQKLVEETTVEALTTMGGWLRGQTILVLAMTTLVSLAVAALGLPHPLLIGLVAGIGEVIPMVGPILGAVVAVPLAFFFLPLWVGFVTLGFFIVLSQVEGNVIVPKVMEKNVELTPFFSVLAVLAGGALAGVVGALLALPLAAAARVFLRRLVIPAIQRR